MIRVRVEIGFSFKRELPDDYRDFVLPEGADVTAALQALVGRFPAISPRLFTERGELRRDIAILINGRNVLRREGQRTPLVDGDQMTLLPPVGGG
jgi:molybdopterin synthase sulfur carrier subunit